MKYNELFLVLLINLLLNSVYTFIVLEKLVQNLLQFVANGYAK